MSVAQDGCIWFGQDGSHVELSSNALHPGGGVRIYVEEAGMHHSTFLTPNEMDDLALELIRWAAVLRGRRQP